MLRALGRTACVLLLAGVVSGALYLVAGAGDLSMADPQGPPRVSSDDGRFGHGRGGRRGGRSPDGRERGGHAEASLGRGIGGMIGTAIQIGVVAAAVVGIRTHARRRRRRTETGPGGNRAERAG
jgi:hypothetical protein